MREMCLSTQPNNQSLIGCSFASVYFRRIVMYFFCFDFFSFYSTQAARDLWWNKLLEVFRTENAKEPGSTNIQVMYYDVGTNIEYVSSSIEYFLLDPVKAGTRGVSLDSLSSRDFSQIFNSIKLE